MANEVEVKNIRGTRHTISEGGQVRNQVGQVLAPAYKPDGRAFVRLETENGMKEFYVDELVKAAFNDEKQAQRVRKALTSPAVLANAPTNPKLEDDDDGYPVVPPVDPKDDSKGKGGK